MKKTLLLSAILICLAFISKSQYSLFINFEDTTTLKFVKIDTANHNNIWQIGKPLKTVFAAAHSAPNAIATDTILPYPVNNHSSFIITIKSHDWFFGSPSSLYFYHQYNTDAAKDGGYIDVSYDGGAKWQNIIFDTILTSCPMYPYVDSLPSFNNLYTATDTMAGGIPAFSGNSNGWIETEITWLFCLGVKSWPPDSAMYRFNFVSDSAQSNKDGWMIDDIYFTSGVCGGIGQHYSHAYNQTRVFPNPATDKISVIFSENQLSTIKILNIQGQLIKTIKASGNTTIDISSLAKGIYFLEIMTDNGVEVKKVIKE